MHSSALVGRGAARAAVDRLLTAACDGRGGMLLCTGEAGIGKSRMLDEARRMAAAYGMVVLAGRAVEGGGTFRPIAEALVAHLRDADVLDAAELRPYRGALHRIVPGWADEVDAAHGAGPDPVLVLGEGLIRLLRSIAGDRGCVVLLEDLHWADADSIAVLDYLAGALGSSPVAVVASARDEPAQRVVAPLRSSPHVQVLALPSLDDEQVTALAATLRRGTALSDAQLRLVIARSDGLPLLVEELVDGLGAGDAAAPVPPSLADLVERRLEGLAPDHARTVQVAAVLGDAADVTALQASTAGSEADVLAALRAATAVQLLVVDAGGLRWRHALTRDAVLATLLPPEHRAIAARGADVLLDRCLPGDDARAADLLVRAQQPSRAADLLLALARRDVARGALRSAAQRLDRVTGLVGERPDGVIERVRVLTLTGRAVDALELGARVVDAVDGDVHAQLRWQLARAAITASRWDAAREHVRQARRPDDPTSLVLAADAAFGDHRAEEARRLATRAVAAAERQAEPGLLCEALIVAARAARADLETASAMLARAAHVAAQHGLTPWRVEALRGQGLVEVHTGLTSATLVQARALALDSGMLVQVLGIDMVLADERCLVDGPRVALPAALAAAEQAAALRLRDLHGAAVTVAALLHALSGDARALQATLETVAGDADASPDMLPAIAAVRGVPLLLAQDLPGAAAVIDQGMAPLVTRAAMAPFSLFSVWVLLRTLLDDRAAEAQQQLRAALAAVRSVNRAALVYAEAITAGRGGRSADAATLLARGDAILTGRHWWRRLLHTLVLDAAVTDGWGDPVLLLRADLAAHEATGDEALARRCRTLLRRAGVDARRGRGDATVPPALRALGITSREVDVLELVAAGLTNAQIAERLVLSPRTVETHVAHLLAKTRSTRRTELSGWIDRLTP